MTASFQNVSLVSKKLAPFGTSIFAEMTRLAEEHGAINLAQGFPDFDGPSALADEVVKALREGHNQYARSMGRPELCAALAALEQKIHGLSYDPATEVVVTSGATEAIAAAVLGLVNPGDEVVLLEPFYDSYPATVAMAGGQIKLYTLRFPEFALDAGALAALFGDRTRLLILNSPHNPTGKVFSRAELTIIADLCKRHDVKVISDEVYEHLTFDGVQHIPIATLPGMRERTLTISSAGKTFSFTGWKIGWAFGPAPMVAALQAAHQFLTFATSTFVQVGLARAFSALSPDYFLDLRQAYTERRNFLVDTLKEIGLEVAIPQGTYFVLARFAENAAQDDLAYARQLIVEKKVAAIPPSFFYAKAPEEGRRLVRFAFCKKRETLEAARSRLLGR